MSKVSGKVPAAEAISGTEVPAADAPSGSDRRSTGGKDQKSKWLPDFREDADWDRMTARKAVKAAMVKIYQDAGMTEEEAKKTVGGLWDKLNGVANKAGNPEQVAKEDSDSMAIDESIKIAKQWLETNPIPQSLSKSPPAIVGKFIGKKLAQGASALAAGAYAMLVAGKHVLGYGGPTEPGESPGIDWAHLGGIDWLNGSPSGGLGTGIGGEKAFLFGVSWDKTTK